MDGEDGMRSGWILVHGGLSDSPVLEPNIHELFHFFCGFDDVHGEILNKNSLVGRFLQLHFSFDIFAEQIMNFFIIDFNETAPNKMFLILLAAGKGDDLAKGPGDDTSGILIIIGAHHGMSFSAASLAVGEDGSIISL